MSNGKISKAVLITGCSTGIGRATALRLAKAGWTVYATARRAETLADLAREGCKTLALDVDSEDSMKAAVDEVERAHGAVGVLINNAGYSQSGAFETVPMQDVRAQFETNVFGLIRLTQLVLPGMRRQGWGRIINLSSMGGKLTLPGFGYYHATKYAVEALSDALRFEVKGFGIRVVIIEPGLIRTDFSRKVVDGIPQAPADSGPYGPFNAAVAKTGKEAYEKGLFAWLGGGPETVAKTIERALNSANPSTRYTVTASATVAMTARRILSDRLWDAYAGTHFSARPGN